jgi:hypothetical protein
VHHRLAVPEPRANLFNDDAHSERWIVETRGGMRQLSFDQNDVNAISAQRGEQA